MPNKFHVDYTESDGIHLPKGFESAPNNTYLFKNNTGDLEYVSEVEPPAISGVAINSNTKIVELGIGINLIPEKFKLYEINYTIYDDANNVFYSGGTIRVFLRRVGDTPEYNILSDQLVSPEMDIYCFLGTHNDFANTFYVLRIQNDTLNDLNYRIKVKEVV